MAQPITLEQAKNLRPGQGLIDLIHTASNGKPSRWRVNGQPKTWKRDTGRVKVPIKWGIYGYSYLTEDNLHEFALADSY